MRETVTQWADRLSDIRLPTVPRSVELARQLSMNERIQLRRLAAVVEQDPGLTAALLRKINALRHKHLQNPVTTVHHGLMMLGMERVRSLPASVSNIDKVDDPNIRAKIAQLFSAAQHAAWQARDWAQLRHDAAPDEHFVGALLHNSAEILLWMDAPALMTRLDEARTNARGISEDAEYVVFGFSLDELTRELIDRWGLPGLLRDSLQPENTQKERALGIMLAARLARTAQLDWYSPETTAVIKEVAQYLGFDFSRTAARLHRTAVDAAREGTCSDGLPAAVRLLHPSRPEAEPGWHQRSDRSPQGALCLIPRPAVARDVLGRLGAGTAMRPPEVLALALEGMHDGLGLNRAVFAKLNRERNELRARQIVGTDNDPAFNNHFVIPLEGKNLFTKLMQQPQALWVTTDSYSRFGKVIPTYFKHLVGTTDFFVLSLFAGKTPIGLFYADRHTDACRLDGTTYHQFKQLALRAGAALSRTPVQ